MYLGGKEKEISIILAQKRYYSITNDSKLFINIQIPLQKFLL